MDIQDEIEILKNLQKKWKGSYMICEKLPGYNDDYGDSWALMNMAGNHLYSPAIVDVTENIFSSRITSNFNTVKNSSW